MFQKRKYTTRGNTYVWGLSPSMQICTKPNGGQRNYKGHIISLPCDIQKLSAILPRHPKHVPVIAFKFRDNRRYFSMACRC